MAKLTYILLSLCLIVPVGAQSAPPKSDRKPSDKLICKRTPEIGSLVKVKKTCLTKGEWQASNQYIKRNWQEASDACRTRGEGGAC